MFPSVCSVLFSGDSIIIIMTVSAEKLAELKRHQTTKAAASAADALSGWALDICGMIFTFPKKADGKKNWGTFIICNNLTSLVPPHPLFTLPSLSAWVISLFWINTESRRDMYASHYYLDNMFIPFLCTDTFKKILENFHCLRDLCAGLISTHFKDANQRKQLTKF